jgi:hypothetical protein
MTDRSDGFAAIEEPFDKANRLGIGAQFVGIRNTARK